MLASFPDLADVIEIVVESKAQHEEAWAGQVGVTWYIADLYFSVICYQHRNPHDNDNDHLVG